MIGALQLQQTHSKGIAGILLLPYRHRRSAGGAPPHLMLLLPVSAATALHRKG